MDSKDSRKVPEKTRGPRHRRRRSDMRKNTESHIHDAGNEAVGTNCKKKRCFLAAVLPWKGDRPRDVILKLLFLICLIVFLVCGGIQAAGDKPGYPGMDHCA